MHPGSWTCGSTWRHTGKRGSSAPRQLITQPTSWPHVGSPTWSSTEQVFWPATKRFHSSDGRPLEACCRPWTWWSMLMSVSMWSLRWHFTNKSVTGAPYSIKSYSLSHSWTLWWRVQWLKQCRIEVAAELQQRWRRTNRRRKSIPRSSSSHWKGTTTRRPSPATRRWWRWRWMGGREWGQRGNEEWKGERGTWKAVTIFWTYVAVAAVRDGLQCSKTCGFGQAHRELYCVDHGGHRHPAHNCHVLEKPETHRHCYVGPCQFSVYIGWQWRNFDSCLCQLVFAVILWVKLSEMFATVISLKYPLLAS